VDESHTVSTTLYCYHCVRGGVRECRGWRWGGASWAVNWQCCYRVSL